MFAKIGPLSMSLQLKDTGAVGHIVLHQTPTKHYQFNYQLLGLQTSSCCHFVSNAEQQVWIPAE